MFTYTKQVPVVSRPDVLVCGAGLAGIGAAVAAARSGAQTMVVERMGFAGGFFTAIIGSAFDGFVDERSGTPVVGGIVFEMLEPLGIVEPGQIADVIAKNNRVETVIASNKASLIAIEPKMVIDCAGDGDVAAWAGAPFEKAEPLQPMSLHFRIAYLEPSFELRRRTARVLEAAHERGDMGLYAGPYPATFSGRDIYFNATRFPGDCTDPKDWTQAEIQGRADAWKMFELWQEHLEEFKDAYFITSGPTAGARESRRIVGD